MRTNIVLNDELVNKAIKLGSFKSKKAAIEAGLKLIIQMKSQEKLRELRGNQENN